jgi:hypothetical protein
MILFKETVMPSNHDNAADLKHTNSIRMTDEVNQRIDYLAKCNCSILFIFFDINRLFISFGMNLPFPKN